MGKKAQIQANIGLRPPWHIGTDTPMAALTRLITQKHSKLNSEGDHLFTAVGGNTMSSEGL